MGILATASGAVAVLVWFFMTRNDENDLVSSASFDGLIPADTTVIDDDFGWAFWVAVGAVALELLATIFVFGTCCLCCSPPKEEEVKEDIVSPFVVVLHPVVVDICAHCMSLICTFCTTGSTGSS